MAPPQPPPQPSMISFLTDVEGDGAYFDRFVRHSQVVEFRATAPRFGGHPRRDGSVAGGTAWNLGEWDEEYFPYDREVAFRREAGGESMLVYGGDLWDKGGADLYVLRQLLALRRRHPARVHFLLGNRDLNKMRFADECGTAVSRDQDAALPSHAGAYWRRGTDGADGPAPPPGDNAAARVRWMLARTMGSVDAFELRRSELGRERAAVAEGRAVPSAHGAGDGAAVTDAEVAQSYLRSCDPQHGILGQYLARAKLMLRFGSVLFMHGALPLEPDGAGVERCPDFPTPWLRHRAGCESLTSWIEALDDFSSGQVAAWQEYRGRLPGAADHAWATEGGYFNATPGGRAFGALLQYGMGTLASQASTRSCVYGSWMHEGAPREAFGDAGAARALAARLARAGIGVVLTGHRPVGDAPWPLRVPEEGAQGGGLWIVPCDTSFSGDVRWARPEGSEAGGRASLGRGAAASGRGEVAFSEPLIRFCPATQTAVSVTIHGRLGDGSYYETSEITQAGDAHAALVGRPLVGTEAFRDAASGDTLEGPLWVKGRVGDRFLVSYGKGYHVWNAYVNVHETGGRCDGSTRRVVHGGDSGPNTGVGPSKLVP